MASPPWRRRRPNCRPRGDTPTGARTLPATQTKAGSASVGTMARSAARPAAGGEDEPSSSSRAVLAHAPESLDDGIPDVVAPRGQCAGRLDGPATGQHGQRSGATTGRAAVDGEGEPPPCQFARAERRTHERVLVRRKHWRHACARPLSRGAPAQQTRASPVGAGAHRGTPHERSAHATRRHPR
jgi:hypothetical protein